MRHPLLIRLVLLAVALGFAWLALTGWLALHMAQYSKNQIGADLQKRRDYLEAALRLNPQEGTAWLNLAELCFAERARAASEGDKDKARALMLEAEIAADHAIDTYPLFQAHRMRAWANYFQTEADAVNRFKALEAFDDALAIYPQDSQLIAQAARVALWNHEPERARRYLELSDQYKIDPHDPRAQNVDILLLRAELARVDGDKSSERRLAEEALQIDPRSGSALLRLASLLMEDAVETDQATGGNLIGSPTGLSFNRLRLLVEAAERKEDLSDAISIVERLLEERARMPSRVAAYDQLLNDVFGKIVNTAMRRNDPYAKLQVIDFALPFLQTMGRERMDGAIRSLASGVVGQVVRTFDGKLLADYLVLLLRHRGDPASSQSLVEDCLNYLYGGLSRPQQSFSSRNISDLALVILLRQRQNEIRSGAKEEPISPQIILDFIHGSLDALSNSAKPEAVTLIIQRLRYHQAALPSREEWISALVVEIAQIAADQIQVESGPGNRDTRSARLLQLIRDPALGIDLDQIDALRESLDQADPE